MLKPERHDQAVLVVREVVVHAVEEKWMPLAPRRVLDPVKDPAVEDVLAQRPREDADREESRDGVPGEIVPERGPAEEQPDDREPGDERRRRVDAREALDDVRLEHPAGAGVRRRLGREVPERHARHPSAKYAGGKGSGQGGGAELGSRAGARSTASPQSRDGSSGEARVYGTYGTGFVRNCALYLSLNAS